MYYCDRTCQRKDWKEAHGFECKQRNFHHNPPGPSICNLGGSEFKFQLMRLLAILKKHPEREHDEQEMYDGTKRSFNNLLSHQDKLEDDYAFWESICLVAMALEPPLLIHCEMSEETETELGERRKKLFRLAGIWKTNAVVLLNEAQNESIGSGIFIAQSYFDHACRPTAICNLDGLQAEVRAIAKIPNGQRPCVTYLAGHRSMQERKVALMTRYNFECKCERCVEEEKTDIIDYQELKSLKDFLPPAVDWQGILRAGERELSLMRKCYVEFDERISNKLLILLQEVASLDAPKVMLKRLVRETEEHLRITFGSESSDLVKLGAVRRQYGI